MEIVSIGRIVIIVFEVVNIMYICKIIVMLFVLIVIVSKVLLYNCEYLNYVVFSIVGWFSILLLVCIFR